jgi:hypothetical protein
MRLHLRPAISALIFIGFASCASAQNEIRDSTRADATETPRRTLTGKERLGAKWTDEQRIDNCHVPTDKRGIKSRPSACPDDPSS